MLIVEGYLFFNLSELFLSNMAHTFLLLPFIVKVVVMTGLVLTNEDIRYRLQCNLIQQVVSLFI